MQMGEITIREIKLSVNRYYFLFLFLGVVIYANGRDYSAQFNDNANFSTINAGVSLDRSNNSLVLGFSSAGKSS